MVSQWPTERDARLKELWLQTTPVLSAAAIGKLLGVTKSAVVGRVRRTKLPPRLSPIVRGSPRPPRVKQPTPTARVDSWRGSGKSQPPEKLKLLPLPDPGTLVVGVGGSSKHCQFIPGDPAAEQTLYCGEKPVDGRSYCPYHLKACSVKPLPHKERI